MKKILLLILTVLMSFGTLQLSAQQIVEIPATGGTATNSYLPSYSLYNYTLSQQIYTATEIGMPGTISSIAFYNDGDTKTRTYTLYMVNTTQSSFSSSSDWITVTASDQVFNGSVTFTGSAWTTITLDMPFFYDGVSNLAIITDDNTGSWSSGLSCYVFDATGMALRVYSDDTDYDPTSPGGYSGTVMDVKNHIKLGITPGTINCHATNAISVSNVTATNATLNWNMPEDGGTFIVQYKLSTQSWDDYDVVSDMVTDTTFEFYDLLTPNTHYDVRVANYCGSGDTSVWRSVSFLTSNIAVQLPYTQDFETNPESITDFMISNNGPNGWYIGSATGMQGADPAVHSLYISNDNGATNTYTNSTTSEAYAVLDVVFDNNPMEWHLAFDYNVNGEGESYKYDYLSVYMMDGGASIPTSGAPSGTPVLYQSNLLSGWTHYDAILEGATGTSRRIVFYWRNDGSSGSNPPAAIDNISIAGFTCAQPAQLEATNLGSDEVTIDWVEAGTATSWTISYGPAGYTLGDDDDEITVFVTSHPYTITDLTPATSYQIYVQSDCGSNWAGPLNVTPGSYTMPATGSDSMTTCGVMIYDDGGVNGNYSANCNSTLVLYPANPGEMMMVTGTCSTESCCDHLYIYDGVGTSGTLLGQYQGSNQNVSVLSTTGPLTIHFTSDGSVFYAGFQLLAECVSCFPPTNITATNPTMDGATISWSGIADEYAIYVNGGANGYFTTTDTTYTITGLNSSSAYSVQIRSLCTSDSSILSSAVTFATSCGAITITDDNPWIEDFESYGNDGAQALVCWATPTTTTFDNGTFPAAYCGYAPACHSGINSAEFKGNSGDVNIAVLPEFTNNIQDLRLSFWATATSTSYGTMEVGVMSDITDVTTFETIATCGTPGSRGSSSASVGNFGNYMGPFDFNGAQTTSGRLAIRFTSNLGSLSWNLDDFIVELSPDCPSPVKTSVTATNIGGHVATISWVDNDPSHSAWTVYYKETTDNNWNTVAASDTFTVLTGLDPETAYDVYVITNCTTPDANPDATLTIHFTTSIACPAPTGLTLASVSTDEATITWNGTADSYNVEYGETGFTPGTGIGTVDVAYTESFTLSNLNPSTSYTIYVNSDCSTYNDSLSTTVSFTFNTTQIPTALPYTSDFTVANEWILNNSTCANYWTIGTVNTVPSLFVTNDGTTPGYNNSSSSVVTAEKLFTVGDDAVFNIGFDVQVGGESSWDYLKVFFAPAESEFPGSTSAPSYASYSYTTNAVNFEDYLSMTGYTSYPYKLNLTTGTVHIAVEMPNPNQNATSNSTAKLVFLWKNDSSGGDNPGAIISNVTVSTNTCPMPSGLATTNVTTNSADLAWVAGDQETEWEVEYGVAGFAHGNGTVETAYTTPTLTISNLTPATIYDVYVRAMCSATDTSAWVGPITVVPGAYIMPSTGTNTITGCDLVIYDDGGVNGGYSNYCESYLTINPENATSLVTIQGTLSTESCCDYLRIYDGPDVNGTMFGEYKGTNVTIPELISTTGPITLYFHSDVSLNDAGFALTVSCASNTCPAPTGLTVSNIGTTTADISWTPGGTESAWVLEYKEATASTWTVTNVNTPSYQLTNLTSLTPYNVRVKADCGAGDESFYKETSFNTNACAASDQCSFKFLLVDGYGDGWNSGYLTVEQNGVVIATLEATNYNLTSTQTTDSIFVSLCDNVSTNLVWHEGNYDDEVGITLYGPDGNQLYTIFDLSEITSNTIYTFTTDCSGSGPGPVTDPTVTTNPATSIAQTTATLNGTISNPGNVTITAKGFEWKTTTGGTYTQVPVTGNNLTYNLSNLTPSTNYTYKAYITFNGTTVYGSEQNFTTLDQGVEPCDVPTGLHTTDIQNESISIAWDANPNVTSWNIQYKPVGGQLSSASSNTNNYTITGLTGLTNYEIQVQAVCASGTSDWCTAITAQTTNVGIANWLENSVTLYPNPAKEYVDIRINDLNVTAMEVYDVYGKLINTISIIDNPTRINVSSLANGMYFVRVTTEQGVVTKQFVKR